MATTGKKGGSKMFWIIGGLIVVAGGIGAYFLLRKPKEEKTETESGNDTDDKSVNTNTGGGGGGSSTNVSSSPKAPAELNTTDKIKAFQDWMDKEGKGWINKDGKWVLLNKGAGYGNYGKSTDAVWKVYGKKYLDSLKAGTKTNTSTATTTLSKDIDTIIKSSTGTKAEKTYLQKTNADFVSSWANAIRNNKRVFIWANQVYRTKTGDKVLEYNPLGANFYAKLGGEIAKTTANDSASAYWVAKGTNLGKPSNIDFNNGVWLYLPEKSSIYKWYKIDYISKTKPTSSFEGMTDELEFANFDNNLDLNL
jgi:hypothetical protein